MSACSRLFVDVSHIGPSSGSIKISLSMDDFFMVWVGFGLLFCARYLSMVTAPPILAWAVFALVGGSFMMVAAALLMLWFNASSLS